MSTVPPNGVDSTVVPPFNKSPGQTKVSSSIEERTTEAVKPKWKELAAAFFHTLFKPFRILANLIKGDYQLGDRFFRLFKKSQKSGDPQRVQPDNVLVSDQKEELLKILNIYQGWIEENPKKLATVYKGKPGNMSAEVKEEGRVMDSVKALLKEADPRQFSVDGSRATYKIEKKVVYKTDNYIEIKEGISGLSDNDEENKQSAKETERRIKEKLENNDIAFQNVSSLLVQTTFADLTVYLQYTIAPQADQGIGLSNGQFSVEHQIQLKQDTYYLTSTTVSKILKPVEDADTVEVVLGYIAIRRQVIISKEELAKDWRSVPHEDIAPGAKVIVVISKFSMDPTETLKDLNQKMKSYQESKESSL
jgi:hypothetical protein